MTHPQSTKRSSRVTRRQLALAAGALTTVSVVSVGASGCASGTTESQPKPAARPAKISVTHPPGAGEQAQLWELPLVRFPQRFPQMQVEEILADPGKPVGEKVLAMIAAGTPPDVVTMPSRFGEQGGAEDLAGRSLLLKLDDHIKRDKALKFDDFWPFVRTVGEFDGSQIALAGATGISTSLVFYNKSLFAAAGRPTPDQLFERKQWTWDTLVNEATLMTKRGAEGQFVQAGVGQPWDWRNWATMLLRSYGADYMNKDGTRVVMETTQGINALRVAFELGARRKAMPLRGEGAIVDLVKAGQVAQGVFWAAASSWWRTTTFDWDVAPPMTGPVARGTAGGTGLVGITRDSKEHDAAWAYTTFVVSPEMDLELATGFGALVQRQSNLPAWRQRMGTDKPRNLQLIEEAAKTVVLDGLRKPHPKLAEVDTLLTREMQALLWDGKPPEAVAKTVTTEGNALLGAR